MPVMVIYENCSSFSKFYNSKPHLSHLSPESKTDNETLANEVTVMGYAMRTPYFRYIAYILFDKVANRPKNLNDPIFLEELYDHRNETLQDFTHRELMNVARRHEFEENLMKLRERLILYLKNEVYYNQERANKVLINGNGKELALDI